jgi:hypothetical protein
MNRILALIGIALLTSACAPTPYWTLTDKSNRQVRSVSYEFTVPVGWVRTTKPQDHEVVDVDGESEMVPVEGMAVTRDGTGIHAINIMRRYADTAFPSLKKKSRDSMLPPEAAELYLSELRKRSGLERLSMVSNKPARIGGKQGFQLLMQYKNNDGLRIQIMTYGFLDKSGFYTLSYRAPQLYFYERDYRDFDNLVRSFRQTKEAFTPPPERPYWARNFT